MEKEPWCGVVFVEIGCLNHDSQDWEDGRQIRRNQYKNERITMKQKPTKAMIDIETMDTLPSSAIVSIGCVLFDESGVSDHRFYRNIDLYSSMAAGGTTGAETIQWWMNQSSQAKQQLLESPVPEAMNSLKPLTGR